MTDRISKTVPAISARNFVRGKDPADSPTASVLHVLQENSNVYVLATRNDKGLSATFDRFAQWHNAGMSSPILTMEKWRQTLEQQGRSCETDPQNCGFSKNITLSLTELAVFYNRIAKDPNIPYVTPQEFQLRKDLEDAGLFTKNARGELRAKSGTVLMAFSRSLEPDGVSKAEIFTDAYLRLLPYIDPEVRSLVKGEWEHLNSSERDFLKTMLAATGHFNTQNLGEILTTISAYSYFSPDQKMGLASLLADADKQCRELKSEPCLLFEGHEQKNQALGLFWKLHNAIAPAIKAKIPKLD